MNKIDIKDIEEVLPKTTCKSKNKNLSRARSKKNDEFYTELPDIENELIHYRGHFRNKVVLCNCDDPFVSNFFKYFSYNFEFLGLKKLITVCYKNQNLEAFSKNLSERAIYLEYDGFKVGERLPNIEDIGVKYLKGDGDFRSDECIELLKQADVVVTNPPFSLFREYVSQLIKYEKKFLIIGNGNAVTYKEIFPLIKNNQIWLGVTTPKLFLKSLGPLVYWFTNLSHKKRNEELILIKKYEGNEKDYPKYKNYDAIEVSKVANIPKDYYGVMGVPISFLEKYNPDQFEIVDINPHFFTIKEQGLPYPGQLQIENQKDPYARILIRRKNRSENIT